MRAAVERCRAGGGFVCVAREHRQSLLLKRQEVSTDAPDVSAALAELEALPVIDILDESDALLTCKQQLVYAWGKQDDLPDAATRWQVPQELLHVLATDVEVQNLLADPHVAEVVQHEGRYGAMNDIRLVRGTALPLWPPRSLGGLLRCKGPNRGISAIMRSRKGRLVSRAGARFEEIRPALLAALATGLFRLQSRSKAFDWCNAMRKSKHAAAKLAALVDAVARPEVPFRDAIQRLAAGFGADGGADAQEGQLLCLRGLLGCGVLVHCLALRHRVDYGINFRCVWR